MTELDHSTLGKRALLSLSAAPRPFLRWAGSKQRLLPQLVEYLPDKYGSYFEPFMGASALFFLLEPENAHLSDMSTPLVQTYQTIAAKPKQVFDELAKMDVLDSAEYYRIRSEKPSTAVRRAARFIYLNRAAWNGLYRVNNKGEFNVPYGRPRSANIIDFQNLEACSGALSKKSVSISISDFQHVEEKAVEGDLVYFDPPYVTGHNNNGFVDYNEKLFSWDDQVRLSTLARKLQERGVSVIVSNAHHDAILDLYPTFNVGKVERRSTLASDISARKSVTEAVFH